MIAYVSTSEKWGLVIGPTDLNHNSTEGSGKSTQSLVPTSPILTSMMTTNIWHKNLRSLRDL